MLVECRIYLLLKYFRTEKFTNNNQLFYFRNNSFIYLFNNIKNCRELDLFTIVFNAQLGTFDLFIYLSRNIFYLQERHMQENSSQLQYIL